MIFDIFKHTLDILFMLSTSNEPPSASSKQFVLLIPPPPLLIPPAAAPAATVSTKLNIFPELLPSLRSPVAFEVYLKLNLKSDVCVDF